MKVKKVSSVIEKEKEPVIDSLTLTKKIKSFCNVLKDIKLSDYPNMEKKNIKEQLDYLISVIYDMEA